MKTRFATLVTTLALAAGGCVINADSQTEFSGQYISPRTLEQIDPGHSEEYVLAVLGEPSTRSQLEDGTEIWKWVYHEERTESGAVFLLYSGRHKNERRKATYVEFEAGVVSKTWQD